MSTQNIKSSFFNLSRGLQVLGIGSALLIISIFLPWYEDLDAYNIGDRFFGITGPTSLIGLFVLALSGSVFTLFLLHLFRKRIPNLPLREHVFNIFVGAQSFFLLIIVNSIFFHSKFGVNITLKESKFGMILAFIGAMLITFGGYLEMRRAKRYGDTGRLSPLIDLGVQSRISEEHRPVWPQPQVVEKKQEAPGVQSRGSYTIRMDL